MNSLLQKAGLSRDQLSHLTRGNNGGASTGSLSNLVQRQNSFDALMSLDFQSLQSIDNLANLIQSGGVVGSNVPESGMKNADFGIDALSNAQRRLASAASSSRMETLLRNLSQGNVHQQPNGASSPPSSSHNNESLSNANLSNLLQSLQQQHNNSGSSGHLQQMHQQQGSASNFFGHLASAAGNDSGNNLNSNNQNSAVSLANLLRQESSTGLSALRMNSDNRNSTSVDDFLSLVAAGDIPHQDPALLNIPLSAMQQQDAVAKFLAAQQQQLQQQQQQPNASSNSNPALANALASRANSSADAAALAMAQSRAAQQKRSAEDLSGEAAQQGNPKR